MLLQESVALALEGRASPPQVLEVLNLLTTPRAPVIISKASCLEGVRRPETTALALLMRERGPSGSRESPANAAMVPEGRPPTGKLSHMCRAPDLSPQPMHGVLQQAPDSFSRHDEAKTPLGQPPNRED